MSIVVDAATDSQALKLPNNVECVFLSSFPDFSSSIYASPSINRSGNRTEESQAAADGLVSLVGGPTMLQTTLQGASTSLRNPEDHSEYGMSLSTFTQSHQPLRSPQRLPASPQKSTHARKPSESAGPASSAGQIAKDLVAPPQNATFRQLNAALDATPAPPTSSASSDTRIETQWANAQPDEFVHTQGPLGGLQSRPKGDPALKIPPQPAEHLSAMITEGPSTSTPRKGVAPPLSPAPTPVVKTSTSSPARLAPAYDSDGNTPPPPIRVESQFTRAPLQPANPCSPARNGEGSPLRIDLQGVAIVRPASASRRLAHNPGSLHMPAVALDRTSSRQRIQEAKPRKRKSNDFDFPESSEDSCKISPEGRPYKRASTSKWGAEERSTSDKENTVGQSRSGMSISRAETSGKELDLTADTTGRSPAGSANAKATVARLAPPNAHPAVPSSSSGGTYLGTQDMSLQVGEPPCSALFDRATGGSRSGLTQTGPATYIVTPQYEESQEEDELDSQLAEKAEAMQQDGNTVPSTSEADLPAEVSFTSNMALNLPEDCRVITSPAAANIADPTPPTEAVTDDEDDGSRATGRGSSRYRSQIGTAVSDSRSLRRESAVSAANSTYMSNGRGVDPPAGRSLQRSRPTSVAYVADISPEEDNQTQKADQGRSQTQKVPTSDAFVEQDRQPTANAELEQVPSSPSALAEKPRLVPDSQHPGRVVEEADRTYATSEADGLMQGPDQDAVAFDPATLAGSVRPEQGQAESSTSHVSESTLNASSKAKKGKQKATETPQEDGEGSAEMSKQEAVEKPASKRKTKNASEHASKRKKVQQQVQEPAGEETECEQGPSVSASIDKSRGRKVRLPDNTTAEGDESRDIVEGSTSRSTRNTSTASAAVSAKNKGKQRATEDNNSVISASTPHGTVSKRTALKDRTNLAKAGAGPASKTGRKASTSAVVAREASQSIPGGGAASRARRVIQNDSLATSQIQDVHMAVDDNGPTWESDEEENERDEQEARPVASTSAAGNVIECSEAPLPVDRIYVKLDKFCYPGRLTLADNGNTPFRVQMDDTTYADLHVHQLSSKLVKCQLYEGDLVVRATNANGVKKDKAKDKREVVRLLKAGTPEHARGKVIPFGTTLMPEDIVVVKAVAGKGQDSSDIAEERWLVEVTVLLPISANAANERKLSSDEIDELEGYLAESQGSATVSASTSRSACSSSTRPSTATASRKSSTPKPASTSAAVARAKQSKLFSSFGLVFTAGSHASIVDPAKEKAKAAGATLVADVSELFTTDDINAESQTDTRLTFDADSQQAGLQTILLIAFKPLTTPKYLKALALGVPCVSVEWVNACIDAEECLPWKPFARECRLGVSRFDPLTIST